MIPVASCRLLSCCEVVVAFFVFVCFCFCFPVICALLSPVYLVCVWHTLLSCRFFSSLLP